MAGIKSKLRKNPAYKGAKDFAQAFGCGFASPYAITSAIKEVRSGPSLEDRSQKQEYSGEEVVIGAGLVSGIVAGIGSNVALAFSAYVNDSPEYLAIPALTNLVSYLGPKLKRKVQNWKEDRKIKRTLTRKDSKLEEKLSFSERLFGKKESNIYVQPRISLTPKVTVYVNDKKQRKVTVEVEEKYKKPFEVDISDPLGEYRFKKKPFYISLNGEKELFTTAYENKLPVMLKGPTGCGKTRFIEHMAHQLKKPLITVNCQEDITAADLVGRILINEEGTYWQDGPLAKAARYGGICYLDEVVEARNDTMVLIHSLTDYRRILPIEKTGEVIKAHPDFMLAISYNPHYQSALKDMKQSTRQRFIGMDFDYPETEQEVKIVAKESGVNVDTARKLVDFGHKVRDMKSQGLEEGASTRLLIYAGQLINSGINKYQAVKAAIASPITDETDLSYSIMQVARTVL